MSEIRDLVGLSKPIEKFLEIAERLLEPYLITSKAKAEVKAALIRHEGEVNLAELRQRAGERLVRQEIQKCQNIEAIVRLALKYVEEGTPAAACDTGDLDKDWIFRFGLEAQEISDETLQDLWARLLARASQSPLRYPRRVFRAVKELEPAEVVMIDELAAKALFVERNDGSVIPFMNVHLREEWVIRSLKDEVLLANTRVEGAQLLQELGILDPMDFVFFFTGEGPLHGDGFHLSSTSARRIFSSVGELIAEHSQPNFVKMDGATIGECGIKTLVFDGWRITELGTSIFSLSQHYSTDPKHLDFLGKALKEAGMHLRLQWNQ